MTKKCKHSKYTCTSKMSFVKEFDKPGADVMVLKVYLTCADCKLPFVISAPHGFSTYEPSLSFDGTELRVPISFPIDEEKTIEVTPEDVVH